ncbi:hypothetical protein ACQW5G_00705 [Fructilactobacillus sp. Tb1]|uniref:hypothetical protein n=1 Tax=Fructilactobacillus sp. Tb1 TaxID=3422304 RepID=UPI003D2CA4A3
MGIFNKETNDESLINDVKNNLLPSDGKKHILMLRSTIQKFQNSGTVVQDKYTKDINDILNYLQDNNYEILDVKESSFTAVSTALHQTLIIYK